MFARISLKQPLRGLAGDKKRTSGECDGNGQKRVVDYLRAKGQYPVNWNAGHTVQSNGWWRRETSSGVFLRNPQTGETFVERVTVSDCPTCDNTINPAELIFGAEPLPLETPLTINRAIPITSEYDVREPDDYSSEEDFTFADMAGVIAPDSMNCDYTRCYPFGWTDAIVQQENAKFMTLWARTNMPDQFDHPIELLTEQDKKNILWQMESMPYKGEQCFHVLIEKNLPIKGNWVRSGTIKNDPCKVAFSPRFAYIFTWVWFGEWKSAGLIASEKDPNMEVCAVVSISVKMPGEDTLQYAMEGAKYVWDNGITVCNPLDVLPPSFNDPSQPNKPKNPTFPKPPRAWNPDSPDNPINPSGPKVPKPPSGDCPCKDLLRKYGLNGIANLDDPDTELLLEWY
jgi:hypothetical protein